MAREDIGDVRLLENLSTSTLALMMVDLAQADEKGTIRKPGHDLQYLILTCVNTRGLAEVDAFTATYERLKEMTA